MALSKIELLFAIFDRDASGAQKEKGRNKKNMESFLCYV
jgi:hypothetical protein